MEPVKITSKPDNLSFSIEIKEVEKLKIISFSAADFVKSAIFPICQSATSVRVARPALDKFITSSFP